MQVQTRAGLTLSLSSLQGHRPLSQPTVEAGPTGRCLCSRSGGPKKRGLNLGGQNLTLSPPVSSPFLLLLPKTMLI